LPADVPTEVSRLGASRAVIVGGTGAVTEAVRAELVAELGAENVERVGGLNRYATAELVAAKVQSVHPDLDGTVFIATGQNFPDALTAGPDAWAKVRPILLTKGGTAPVETLRAIASLAATRAVVLGGTGAVPPSAATAVQGALGGAKTLVRLAGATRYETAQSVVRWTAAGEGLGWGTVGIATGADFPDALGGGPAMGAAGGQMMLTDPTVASPATVFELTANKAVIGEVRFFGGTGVIPTSVRTALMHALD
jgi:putative cell wall-binding protein